jgi:hypothetical protein
MRFLLAAGVALGLLLMSAAPASAQFVVRLVDAPDDPNSPLFQLNDIEEAETLLNNPPTGVMIVNTTAPVINYVGTGGDGDFADGLPFPDPFNMTDDFALQALFRARIVTAGSYIFRVGSDDGFRVRIGVSPTGAGGTVPPGNGPTSLFEFSPPRAPGNTDSTAQTLAAGTLLDTRLTFYERGGGEEIELSYSLNGGPFTLVGTTPDIVISPIPEPATLALTGVGLLGVIGCARRRKWAVDSKP